MLQDKQPKTRETIEYEAELKKLHELSLKSELSKEGIDTSKLPRKVLDDILRLANKQGMVRRKYQEIITTVQQEAGAKIAITQQEMQAELLEMQKEGEMIINKIKMEQGLIPHISEIPQAQPEPEKESADVKKEPETQGDEK